GGGIAAEEATYLAMTGTTVDHNTSTNDFDNIGNHGGGVNVSNSVMYANASTFASNRASSTDEGEPSADGGGIRGFDATVQLVARRVVGNLSNDDGGGIDFHQPCNFCFVGLRPKAVGAAFPSRFDVPSGLTVDGTTVDHNQAVNGAGGGIALETDDLDTSA